MRTLKKTLCLVLAVVLCFGLVGTAFAGNLDKYSDAKDIDANYVEAVDVFTGLGILEGDAGAFAPNGTFTRAAVAKIAAYMTLGSAAKNLAGATASYTDVAKDYWAMPFIAYCDSIGLIEGDGNGLFRPDDAITGFEGSVIFLRCLGYGVKGEYSGSDWTLVASKDGIAKKIFNGDLIADGANSGNALQRDQAVQMAFNAMSVPTVKFSAIYSDYVENTDNSVGTTVKSVKLAANFPLNQDAEINEFGINGYYWVKGAAINAKRSNIVSDWYQSDTVVAEYTDLAAVTAGELYNLGIEDTDITAAYVNGDVDADALLALNSVIEGTRGGRTKSLAAFNGATLILLDTDTTDAKKADKAVLKIEYLAKVDKVQAETTTAEAYIDLTVYDVNVDGSGTATAATKTAKVYTKDYNVTDIAKGDYVLVVPGGNSGADFAAPISIKEVAPVTASVTAYTGTTSVTFGGTAYGYSKFLNTTAFAIPTYKFAPATYDFYLNSIGDVIGVKGHTGTADSLNYVYITGAEIAGDQGLLTGNSIVATTARVGAVYMDGTAEIVDLAVMTAAKDLYFTTATHVAASASTASTTTIAKGNQYVVISALDSDNNLYYPVADAAVNATGDNANLAAALAGNVFSYSKADSKLSLSSVVATTGTPVVTADAYDTTGDKVSVVKGSPLVTVDPNASSAAVKYATTGTKLVLRAADATVSTITGYANFKTADYTVGTGSVSAIVTVTNALGGISDVLVIGGAPTADDAVDAYGYCTGAGAVTADGTLYKFLVNGEEKSYALASGVGTPSTGEYYAITLNDKGAIAKLDDSKDAAGVVAVNDGYIYVGGSVYYTDKTFATVDITTASAPEAGTLENGDTAVVMFSTDSNSIKHVEAIFITAKA